MSLISIDAKNNSAIRVMEKTPCYILSENLFITVPANYTALLLAEGFPPVKVKPCQKKKVIKYYGSENAGRYVCALFTTQKPLPTMSWGIGNLNIAYPSFEDTAYRVGANGSFLAEISDHSAFIESFPENTTFVSQTATISTITTAFREIASVILVELFNQTGEPVLKPEFMLDEMNLRLRAAVCNKNVEQLPGIRFISAYASTLCINEDDVQNMKRKLAGYRRKAIKKELESKGDTEQ